MSISLKTSIRNESVSVKFQNDYIYEPLDDDGCGTNTYEFDRTKSKPGYEVWNIFTDRDRDKFDNATEWLYICEKYANPRTDALKRAKQIVDMCSKPSYIEVVYTSGRYKSTEVYEGTSVLSTSEILYDKNKKNQKKYKGTQKAPSHRYRCRRNPGTNTRKADDKSAERMFGITGLTRYYSVVNQSNVSSRSNRLAAHLANREKRDEQQRVQNKRKIKQAYKAQPKSERAANVAQARKNAEISKNEFVEAREEYQMQSKGRFLAASAVGIGLAAVGIKTSKALTDNIKDKIKGIYESVMTCLKSLFGELLWRIPLIMFTWWLLRKVFPGNPIIQVFILTLLNGFLSKQLIELVTDLFKKEDEIENQSSGNALGYTMASLMAVSIFKRGRGQREIGEFAKRIGTFDRTADGLDSFFGWVTTGMKSALNYVSLAFSGGRCELFKKTKDAVNRWMDESDKILKKLRTYKDALEPEGTVENADKLVALLEEGFQYRTIYQGTDMYRAVNNVLAELSVALRPYASSVAARNNHRFEPRMAVLVGDPGIGKTLLASHIVSTVLVMSGLVVAKDEAEISKHIWQKGTSKYWNGYNNQIALVMDDAFQAKAALMDEENDYLHIIKAVGTWAFPLNMADLDSKGRIYFTSKFIFATTNVECIRSEAYKVIHSPEAVFRRFTHPYKLFVKEEYKKNSTLNLSMYEEECLKLKKEGKIGVAAFPWHIWEVAKHDFITGVTDNIRKPMYDLIIEMARDLKKRKEIHEHTNHDLSSYISGLKTLDEMDAEHAGVEIESQLRPVNPRPVILFGPLPRPRPEPPRRDWKTSLCDWFNDHKWFTEIGLAVMCVSIGLASAIATAAVIGLANAIKCALFPSRAIEKYMKKYDLRQLNKETADYAKARCHANRFDDYCVYINKDHEVVYICYTSTRGDNVVESVKGKNLHYFTDDIIKKHYPIDNESAPRTKTPPIVRIPVGAEIQFQGASIKLEEFKAFPESVVDEKKNERTAINNAVYSIVLRRNASEDVQHIGNFMMVNTSLAVMPKHYRIEWNRNIEQGDIQNDDSFHIINTRTPSMSYNIPVGRFLSLPYKTIVTDDVEFVDFTPLKIRAHRNIKPNFMREADISRYVGHSVRLDVPVFTPQKVYTHRTEVCKKVEYTTEVMAPTSLSRAWKYPKVDTEKGDCGSPITMVDMSALGGRVCMGYHSAAVIRGSVGYGSIITQEMIEAAEAQFSTVQDNFLTDIQNQGYPVSHCDDPFPEMGSFKTIGKIDASYNTPKTSKYYPIKEVYGMFGEYNYFPARLSPFRVDGELRVPMLNAVEPYRGPVYHYHHAFLDQAVHVAMKPFSELSQFDTREILSIETAVLGDPLMKLRAIPRNTSPGFPHALTHKNGKKSFFGDGVDYDLTKPEFIAVKERVETILESAKNNVRLSHVFIDFLKDELRSEEKVTAGKTRLISCAPMEYTIAVRMMFGAFTSSFFRRHTDSGMCPGICAYTDWNKLYSHLQKKGKKVFDGDFKGYDSSEQADLLEKVCDYINVWYDDGPDNARIRKILFLELTHSRHLGGCGNDQSFIYQWNRSLPSGHPLTTIVNSMYALILLVACYIKITGDLKNFWEHVSAATYGDDNIVNATDAVSVDFNQVTVSRAMDEEFGMIYTSGKKDGKLQPNTTIDKATFLQRGFRVEDGNVYSPLNLDSFLYTPYWGKNRLLEDQIVVDCMEKALEELSQHPREEWDEYAPKIHKFLMDKVGSTRAAYDRSAYQLLISSYFDSWY